MGGERDWMCHHLFQDLPKEILDRVSQYVNEVTVERGERIYTPREFQRCLGLLLQGQIQVEREQMVVSVLGDGDLFGAAALFQEGEDYPTTLVALAPCSVAFISQEGMTYLIHHSGVFAQRYICYLSQRIHFLSHRLDTLSTYGGEGRLAQYLLTMCPDTKQLTLSATQLCQRIAVGRATLYRAFEALEGRGAISRKGKTIVIEDIHALEEFIGHPNEGKDEMV